MPRAIDVHAHVGKTIANNIGQSVDEMLARLAASGISQALLSPAAADRQAEGIVDTRRMNDVVATAVHEHPEQFPVGLGLVEPRHGGLAVAELLRVLDDLGLAGIAVHPMLEGYYLDVPLRVDPLFEILNDRRALCLMHCSPDPGSGESPRAVRVVCSKFLDVTIFLGHAFLTPGQLAESVQIAKDLPNVLLDVAYQSDPRLTETLVAELGSERVVFGTDQPFYPPGDVLGSVERSAVSQEDKDNILFRNVERILAATSDPSIHADRG